METKCEECWYNVYDEELDANVCEMYIDEDEWGRMLESRVFRCPYFKPADDYYLPGKQ